MDEDVTYSASLPSKTPLSLDDVLNARAYRYIQRADREASMAMTSADYDLPRGDYTMRRREAYKTAMRRQLGNPVRIAPRSYL